MTVPREVGELTAEFLDQVDARLPGRVSGLFLHGSLAWGELFAASDVDFVAVWDRLPAGAELDLLADAHRATRERHPRRTFDGFHCTAGDLESEPGELGPRPVFYESAFDPAGTLDINPVTWCELTWHPVTVRGELPRVRADLDALVAYTRENLATYWRGRLEEVEGVDSTVLGGLEQAIVWITLGPARLHHLLRHRRLTSKSGAGRYVLDDLDPRWARIAREALRIREDPGAESLYDDPGRRGADAAELMRWLVDDGAVAHGVQPGRG